MSKTYLLVDFGASRIKTAILSRGSIMFVKEFSSIDAKINDNKYYEISAEKLKSFFLNLAQNQYKEYSYAGILISSEMHGFMLVDSKNKPLTDYISWKDERCLNEENIEEYNQFSNKFKSVFLKKTGLELKPCLPVTKIKAVANECKLKNFKVISLPEWLSCCSNLSLNIANETMSAGLGFFNIIDKKWDEEIIGYFKEFNIEFNKVTDKIEIAGYFQYDNLNIPIFTGIGDFQAAISGAGCGKNIVNINLGTGSQVAKICNTEGGIQIRPFFNNEKLSVITHIPSGRALNTYINFLKTINNDINYWKIIDSLNLEDVINSTLTFDLGVFSSAWNFSGFGKIDNILENNFTLQNFLASLLNSYLRQYVSALKEICKDNNFNKIIISGGIASKVGVIKDYFEYKYPNIDVIIFKSVHDTTILGLKKIAESIDGENYVKN